MTTNELAQRIAWLINQQRPQALKDVAFLRYPLRELRICNKSDGTVFATLPFRGGGYKTRGRKHGPIPDVDLDGVRCALETHLPDTRISVLKISDSGIHIHIKLEKR